MAGLMAVLGAFDEAVNEEGEDSAILSITVNPKDAEPQTAEGDDLRAVLDAILDATQGNQGRLERIEGMLAPGPAGADAAEALAKMVPMAGEPLALLVKKGLASKKLARLHEPVDFWSWLREGFRRVVRARKAKRTKDDRLLPWPTSEDHNL